MRKEIPLSVPNLDMDILENVRVTIESGWVSTGGLFIPQFEEQIREYTKAGGARSVQSGTAGLHVALRVLGVEANDEIIVPALTFIATVNPVRYVNAIPVFMDCDDSLNMDPMKLRDFLEHSCEMRDGVTYNKETSRPVRGLIIVHIFGNPADMESIMDIASEYHLFVLEDATEALGSYYLEGRYAGKHCGTIGDMGVYSFNANKIITTGNGGMIVSNHQEYLDAVNYLSVQAKTDPLRYVHDDIGYNYRLTNISAAFGVSQIEKIEQFIETKQRNYRRYVEGIKEIEGLKLMEFHPGTRANHWFYSLFIDPQEYGMDREALMAKLLEKGIHTRPIWGLIPQQKPYRHYQHVGMEKAAYYVEHILNIPCSSNLTTDEVDIVIEALKDR